MSRLSLTVVGAGLAMVLAACATQPQTVRRPAAADGATAWDPAFHAIVAADARVERLAGGFTWAEGPLWIEEDEALLFTDVPENRIHRWSPAEGASVFLEPSGYAGPDLDTLREPGANGLVAAPDGDVLMANSGSRAIARLDLGTRRKTPLATHYDGRRFNSPNDLVRRSDGRVFFTDPPYGLRGMAESPVRELPFSGVYRLDPGGRVVLLDASLRFPNGIALAPDGRTLYVANSDPARPLWMAYALDAEGAVSGRRVFADASDLVADDAPGLPDGMAVAADGTLFATGPGGVLVFAPDGRRLGRIAAGGQVANCALDAGERWLYLTAGHSLARIRLRPE
ncbi:SMP-30/gluconolactonase/LRE family protein [Coralloluteibacterium stylophorae]|uniref:SMP-30/gluconolactonase/LRE family protein n=1 Tax=Coralloluteibacterium stylophorae TaxID=1776034 RepID=A0A8J8AWX9_9GAMM|nr:SMP-30/gluconolactonase/LRE family protein [Coralloluteibacterium stylophorae]MBS7458592.1 SMP-30/gluconolactonase/LRE family protein [Coralloluteibacterium stylophorae]